VPEVLTVGELVNLLSAIPELFRRAVFLDGPIERTPKSFQELLRHATLKVTMDTYVQAVSEEKREAQNKVVKMLLPGMRRAVI
jgi:hypothetical protein